MVSHILANSPSRSALLRMLKPDSFPVAICNSLKWLSDIKRYCKAREENDGGEETSERTMELKRKGQENLMEAERAPSTAEEFRRVAAEKRKEDSDQESNKNKDQHHGGGDNQRKR